MPTRADRLKLHNAINNLKHEQVADIVTKTFPRLKPEKVDLAAKKIVEAAHRLVSPRK